MDAAWVPVVAGAAGGVITGAVTLVGQWLVGRHQRRERLDGLTWERDLKRADAVSGAYNAIAQLQVALKQTEGWLATWDEHGRSGPRPELDRDLAANVLAAVDHLRSFGLLVETKALRTHLLDHLYRASSQQEDLSSEALVQSLEEVTERIGETAAAATAGGAHPQEGNRRSQPYA